MLSDSGGGRGLETSLADVTSKGLEGPCPRSRRPFSPLGFDVGDKGFTEDWALVEVDRSKTDTTKFVSNVVGLGTTIPVDKFTL